MMLCGHVTFETLMINTHVGLLVEGCSLELREMWAGYTNLGCLSTELVFEVTQWMIEITQEESVAKTETWDAPTVRDLTEEEEDS